MSRDELELLADHGSRVTYKMDRLSLSALNRLEHLFKFNSGIWFKRDYIVRAAIRHYLKHIQRMESKLEVVEELTKAVEGRI